jgi:hypothetical protein
MKYNAPFNYSEENRILFVTLHQHTLISQLAIAFCKVKGKVAIAFCKVKGDLFLGTKNK